MILKFCLKDGWLEIYLSCYVKEVIDIMNIMIQEKQTFKQQYNIILCKKKVNIHVNLINVMQDLN